MLAPLGLFLLASCGQTQSDESVRSGSEAVTGTCVLGQECCPANYKTVTLTQNSDTFSATAANQCIVALGGSDTIVANLASPIVLAGPGDDTIMAGPNSLVRGGDGRDTINIWGGPSTVYGGAGDDTINAANGDNLVVPGPGNDTVATGTGNDTVALYDMCEITGGVKTLDGGSGTNTLITPVPLAQLKALGWKITNFQNIVVQANSCKSECVTQPDCSGNGSCVEGPTAGSVQCKCSTGFQGAKCNVKTCISMDDTDHDGDPDCTDQCPYDPNKTLPGICGCNNPETDIDGDGTMDCIEVCDHDPNNTSSGQCGCVGESTLKPKGTPCSDKACPGPAGSSVFGTCDGAGVCGDRSTCNPSTVAGACHFVEFQGTSYYVCGAGSTAGLADGGVIQPPGQLTEAQAELACTAKGMTLSRINSLEEERYFARIIGTPLWLGANDISANNNWRWSAPNTNDGDVFWTGGATGKVVPGRFAYWAVGAPGAQRCASMRIGDGRWVDTNCSEKHGFMCQYATPFSGPQFPPRGGTNGGGGHGSPTQPTPLATTCVPEPQSTLPGTKAELQAELTAASNRMFGGAAANPPPDGGICPQPDPRTSALGLNPEKGGGCLAKDIKGDRPCAADSDCAGFGSDYFCRSVQSVPGCLTPDAGPQGQPQAKGCVGGAVCVEISCPQTLPPCDEIDICDPGTTVDAGLDPGANLDAGTYDPAKAFGGALPDAGSVGSYSDPADDGGVNHTWCSMKPQHGVVGAHQPAGSYNGNSGTGSKVQFSFNPDLTFDVEPNPLALGESNSLMHAKAQLGASVHVNDFLTVTFDQEIVFASAGITVDHCSIDSEDDTKFRVFGADFVPLSSLGIPIVNTNDADSPASSATQACKAGLAAYTVAADRAKKSFRDAQQLLSQYWDAQKVSKTLPSNLCHTLGVDTANTLNFPGGNVCPANEKVETTINRFVDYYQKDGVGELSRLRQAAGNVANVNKALRDAIGGVNLQFANSPGDESTTVVNAPFVIGPIPMVLQIDVFATYGITGNFEVGLDLPQLLDAKPGSELQVAHARASVVPYASAGLSAFVGAGFDLGPFAATVGVEGALTLANVQAPIFAGAHLGVIVQQDMRPLPPELKAPVSVADDAYQFLGGARSFKFFAGYDYGAGVDLVNVLSGEINGRLRIRFTFFSRTWRKRIVKFNGWSKHYNLVQGGGTIGNGTINSSEPETQPPPPDSATDRTTTTVASGEAPEGLGETQVPLMQLQPLPIPTTPFTTTTDFNSSQVQAMFYDNLCCLKPGLQCSPNDRPACCPGEHCEVPPTPPDAKLIIDIGTCQVDCKPRGASCQNTGQCCQDVFDEPTAVFCGAQNTCRVCAADGASCQVNSDCCDKPCTGGLCTDPVIIPNPPR
jgi:Lectin C-type domain